MELATGVREQLVRKGKLPRFYLIISLHIVQNDVDSVHDRMNKLENSGKVKAAMAKAGMDPGMINTIMDALNDMQDRLLS